MASTEKMKCASCNERYGKTRCEGCNTLFCLPCMNKHHEELAEQFELLMDVRNEVKQSLDIYRSTSSNGEQMYCLAEIDEWERKTIQRIQQVTTNARRHVNELMSKHMNELSDRFEQISVHLQQQQKEADYLESDIETIKNQLSKLKDDVKHVIGKIKLDFSISNDVEWDTLIYVVEEELPNKATSESVQINDKFANTNKNLGFFNKLFNPKKFDDSLRTIFPTEQSARKTPKSSSIIVHYEGLNPASNNSSQRTNRSEICALCEQPFGGLKSEHVSLRRDYRMHNPTLHKDALSDPSNQLPPTHWYLPVNNDPGYSSVFSPIPKTIDARQVACPNCKHVNRLYNLTSNSEFRCRLCTNPLPLN